MTDERQANVVLTADTSGYDQELQASTRQTNTLADSVDNLTRKLGDLSRAAGRKLTIFAAADVASITAATYAYANFEHQMQSLNAQAGVLYKTTDQANSQFKVYTKTVQDMRKEFPTTTAEASQLVSVLSKFTGQSSGLENLARTFYKAQYATGESATQISQSMLGLQKTMGTNLSQTSAFTDQIVALAAKTPASASAILEFANQLGPVAKIAGLSQTAVTGVSTAFLRAGQDGQVAANAFTKMLNDVTYATQSGSPDLYKYANLVGMTADQFKSMDRQEGILRIFESLNKMGPDAIQTLNRLGLDGARTIRAITAVSNQQGGLRGAVAEAAAGYGGGATDRGAERGMEGLANSMTKFREQMKKLAEDIGSTFAPMMEKFVDAFTVGARAIDSFINGPAGKLLQWAVALAAPFAAIGGGLLLMAPLLAKFASAAFFIRGGLVTGARDAYRGNVLGPASESGARAFTFLPGSRPMVGQTGASVAAGQGGMVSRGGYIAGNAMGAMLFSSPAEREAARAAGRVGFGERMMAAPLQAGAFGANAFSWFMQPGTREGWRDATTRPGIVPSAAAMKAAITGIPERMAGMPGSPTEAKSMITQAAEARKAESAAIKAAAAAQATTAREASYLSKAFAGLRSATVGAGATLGRVAGNVAMVGAMGAGKLGMAAAANPMMAAMLGLMIVPPLISMLKGPGDQTSSARPVSNMDLGIQAAQSTGQNATLTPLQQQMALKVPLASSRGELRNVSLAEVSYARSTAYQPVSDIGRFKDDEFEQYKHYLMSTMASQRGMDWQSKQVLVNDTINRYGADAGKEIAKMLSGDKFSIDYAGMFSDIANAGSNEDRERAAQDLLLAQTNQIGANTNISQRLGGTTALSQFNAVLSNISGDRDVMGEASDNLETILGIADIDLSKLTAYSTPVKGGMSRPQPFIDPVTGLATPTLSPTRLQTMTPKERNEYLLKAFIASDQFTSEARTNLIASSGGVLNKDMSNAELYQKILDTGISAPTAGTIYQAQASALQTTLANYGSTTMMTPATQRVLGSPQMIDAITHAAEDQNAQFEAMFDAFTRFRRQGSSLPEIAKQFQQGTAGMAPDDAAAVIYQAGIQFTQQQVQNQIPFMSRAGGFGLITNTLNSQLQGLSTEDPNYMQTKLGLEQQITDQKLQQYQYYKQIALQGREMDVSMARAEVDFGVTRERMEEQFDISRSRAEEDFNLQRKYGEQDYQLSRQRAEQDYSISRHRAQESFDRSQHRSADDYYLSRRRQEEDFNHQVEVMTEQAAKSQLNIYERVTTQRTISSGALLTNARDQLTQMRGQESNLDRLRQMGLSDQAIQQLGFTDPQNAQQLARFMQDVMQNPSLIQEFNRQIRQRIKAAGEIVTDQSSMDWKEFTRQYNLARERGAEDFRRAMRRASRDFQISMKQNEDDFRRGLRRQQEDYDRMLERQADQFHTAMDRQEADYALAVDNMEEDFAKSMRRAANDLNRMATDISGRMPEIMKKALQYLKGGAREQAQEVMKVWRDLKDDVATVTGGIAAVIENRLGVPLQYHHMGVQGQPELGARGGGSHGRTTPMTGSGTRKKNDKGPEDNVIFFPLPQGSYSVGRPFGFYDPQYATDHHTGQDFPAPYGTPIYAIMDGDVEMAGWDGAYGNNTRLYHGDNRDGKSVETWYAHQSAQRVHQGDDVQGGHHIGNVGDTGNAQGYHLHLEYRIDGVATDPMKLLAKGAFDLQPGDGVGARSPFNKEKFLSRIWPKVEEAAAKVQQGGGYAPGDWSSSLNWTALQGAKKWARQHDTTIGQLAGDFHLGRPGNLPTPTGTSAAANMRLGRQMMLREHPGWQGMWPALRNLWVHESGWDETAENPYSGAYGIPQSLPGSKMASSGSDWRTNPATQIDWGLGYIKDRYGDPRSAWDFWQRQDPHWYREGAIFSGARKIGIGEHGPEMVLPLDRNGAEFIGALLSKVSPGLDGRINASSPLPQSIHHNVYHQMYDRRTQFSGPIQVTSNDVNQFVAQMRQRQRHENLIQPALAGR